jgi:hypothetical protein
MIQASIAANEGGDASTMRRMFDEISDPARQPLDLATESDLPVGAKTDHVKNFLEPPPTIVKSAAT